MSVDIGIVFKGMESGMLRGIFKKETLVKDTGKEEMDIGKGIIREVDISNGDLEGIFPMKKSRRREWK
jgi:hypothetical protein